MRDSRGKRRRGILDSSSGSEGEAMEIQVQELLDRIKAEGVNEAKLKADEILEKARQSAESIVAQAEKEAVRARKEAENHIASMEAASKASLAQAARDAMLAFKKSVGIFLENAVVADAGRAFDAAAASRAIPEILSALSKEGSGDFEVLFSPELIQKIDSALASRLSAEIARGVSFKPYPGLDAGFRVSIQGSSLQYDFSMESVRQILSARVNKVIGGYLDEALKSLS